MQVIPLMRTWKHLSSRSRRGCGLVALLLASCVSFAGPAFGQGVVVSTGPPGGYYHWMGVRLGIAFFNAQGPVVEQRASKGSIENLERLDNPDSPVNLTMTQADAYKRYLDAYPRFKDEAVVLTDFGAECAFLITSREAGIKSLRDLAQKSEYAISVGSEESGPAISYDFMSRLNPELRNTSVVHVEPMRALLQIQSPGITKLRSLLLVQRPRTVSPALEVVLDNPDEYRIVSIQPRDMKNAVGHDGQEIYSFENVKIGFGTDHSVSFDTFCTRGFLLASKKKLNEAAISRVSTVLLEQQSYIMPRRRD